jgi:ATP-dependent DNA ligase
MGEFTPTGAFYTNLTSQEATENCPEPALSVFSSASLDETKFETEDPSRWQAEWKWDGIRAQVIKRADQVFIWSRGEDLVTHQFPEVEAKLPMSYPMAWCWMAKFSAGKTACRCRSTTCKSGWGARKSAKR